MPIYRDTFFIEQIGDPMESDQLSSVEKRCSQNNNSENGQCAKCFTHDSLPNSNASYRSACNCKKYFTTKQTGIDGSPWMLQSEDILRELGFQKVSDEDMLALFRALGGGRVASGHRGTDDDGILHLQKPFMEMTGIAHVADPPAGHTKYLRE